MDKTPSKNRKAYLIPYPIESFSRPIVIEPGSTYIGRSPDGDIHIQLNDRGISRKHARIFSEDRQFFIEDLDSQNGTFLNKARITRASLNSRDKISMGSRTYQFLMQPDTACGFRAEPSSDAPTISVEEMDLADIWAQNANHAAREFIDQDADNDFDTRPFNPVGHKRLSLLYQLSDNLRTASKTADVYEESIHLIMEAIPSAEYALVAERSLSDDAFTVLTCKLRDQRHVNDDAIPLSHTVFDWVHTEKVTLVSQNLGADQRFMDSESIRIHDLRSIICAPIAGKNEVIGLLYAQANNLLTPFTKDDAKFVSAVANEMALNIDNIRLQRNVLRNTRLAAIGLTVSNLAHNINNLLALNQAAGQLMDVHIKDQNYTAIAKNWKWIKASLDGINKLSTDMLEYAKEDELRVKPVDVNRLILANRQLLENVPAHDGLGFEYALTDQNTSWKIDADQLQQALLNLILNAADALSEKQMGRILISTSLRNGRDLLVSVGDNGCGIPEKDKRKVLELFYTTKGSKGTGLGLPMVQRFVTKSGGKLKLQSEEAKGTIVTMVFPAMR